MLYIPLSFGSSGDSITLLSQSTFFDISPEISIAKNEPPHALKDGIRSADVLPFPEPPNTDMCPSAESGK